MEQKKGILRFLLIIAVGFVIFMGVSSVVMWKVFVRNPVKEQKVFADAVILRVERTGLIVENRTGLKLLLKVEPENDTPFEIWLNRAFYSPDVYLFVPGAKLKVAYPVNKPEKLYIVSNPSPNNLK